MNGIGLYQENAVLTQDRGRLIVMLYDGAIKFLKLAIRDIQAQDWAGKGVNIQKAINIITELNTVLDVEAGGEIAENLRSLYSFMIKHLTQANIKKDIQMVQDVIKCLDELNQGWKAIV